MDETSVTLRNISVKSPGSEGVNETLNAARNGNASELKKLMQQKVGETHRPLYPQHWKVTFKDLCQRDEDERSPLHLAAAVGDSKMSLECVKTLLESVQLMMNEKDWPDYEKKYYHFVNLTDANGETALHIAIENGAADVAAYLLKHQADISAKDRNRKEALRLIYENLPEAMTQLYDEAIQLTPNCKGLDIGWVTIIGVRLAPTESYSDGNVTSQSTRKFIPETGLWIESQNLKYVLTSDKWGARILIHPLVKLYLEQKWNKIQWFFWVAFTLEVIWLLLYAASFVTLHVDMKPENSTENGAMEDDKQVSKGCYTLWLITSLLTIFCALKEVYQMFILRKAYASLESILRDVFILLILVQCAILLQGDPVTVMTTSVIGIILGTMLMIFQLGKTPYFGLQVAAWKKVMFSFVPHVPVFCTWFAGFGLIFWAILYQAEKSWLVGMVAIMAAMGTGEINAEEHLKPTEGETTILKECIRAFAILFFVVLIVTLYFNLLIGYAVTDIKILKKKAKALQLSNKLSTIYTIESFLISGLGRLIVRFKCQLEYLLPCLTTKKIKSSLEAIYIIPPKDFHSCRGRGTLELSTISPKLRNLLNKIAYENKERKELEVERMKNKVLELLGIREENVK